MSLLTILNSYCTTAAFDFMIFMSDFIVSDALQALLDELQASNMLHGESTWVELRDKIMQDVRYSNLLGQSGIPAEPVPPRFHL